MKVYFEEGYQGITFRDKDLARTPIYPEPISLIDHLDFAKKTGLIDTYMVLYVKARNTILSPEEVEYYREKNSYTQEEYADDEKWMFEEEVK